MKDVSMIACTGNWQETAQGLKCSGEYYIFRLAELQEHMFSTAPQLTLAQRGIIISALIGLFALVAVYKTLYRQARFS